jgi:molybdopterin-synthase adenylyltransferase
MPELPLPGVFDQVPVELADSQLLRYSRHILLPEMDYEGQQRLLSARVMIVGLGGLGCPAALYLAASGVGNIILVDPDKVELSNLQRQIAHGQADIGRFKVDSARDQMLRLNPELNIEACAVAADEDWLLQHLPAVDLLLDCTDRAAIRYQINRACLQTGTDWLSAAAVGLSGQLTLFRPTAEDSPCYRCLYPHLDQDTAVAETLVCADSGVLAPLVGVVGTLQAAQALKYLAGIGTQLDGRLQTLDLLGNRWQQWQIQRQTGCPDCGMS